MEKPIAKGWKIPMERGKRKDEEHAPPRYE
jgi:hypothetical protein